MRCDLPVLLASALLTIPAAGAHGGASASTAPAAPVQASARPTAILFRGVRVYDGRSDALTPASDVLVVANRIRVISTQPIAPPSDADVRIFEGQGRVLMPGLIDAHTHVALSTLSLAALLSADPNYVALRSGVAAADMLQRGFTSVRDVGGPLFGLKRAIDEGLVSGPRIWPSGATISQTSGHGDFRTLHDLPRVDGAPLHFTERIGATAIADGVDEVLRRVREQLFRGAAQIKLMAGGGVSSDHDPLDVVQYTESELRAAVDAAAAWGTYVTVHAYTGDAIRTAIRAGVRCIEHGQLADEDAARLMAEKGVWWCLQPFLDDEDAIPQPPGSPNAAKRAEMTGGTDRAYALAKRHRVKVAFGTDALFDARLATRQGAQLAKLARWYAPAEVLRMATSQNAELLALSGPRNPYPGVLGVIEPDALADLLLVDGDPLADLGLIADPARNFVVIVKDGRIVKDALPR